MRKFLICFLLASAAFLTFIPANAPAIRTSACVTKVIKVFRSGNYAVGTGYQYCAHSDHYVTASLQESVRCGNGHWCWVQKTFVKTKSWGPGKLLRIAAWGRCTYWGSNSSYRWWRVYIDGWWWNGSVWVFWQSWKQALIRCA